MGHDDQVETADLFFTTSYLFPVRNVDTSIRTGQGGVSIGLRELTAAKTPQKQRLFARQPRTYKRPPRVLVSYVERGVWRRSPHFVGAMLACMNRSPRLRY